MIEISKKSELYEYISSDESLKKYFDDIFNREEFKDEDLENFEPFLGGEIHLIEDLEDLKNIKYHIFEDGILILSDLSKGPGNFDIYEKVSPDFLVVANMTNNSGGTTYIIPKKFITENVANSKEAEF